MSRSTASASTTSEARRGSSSSPSVSSYGLSNPPRASPLFSPATQHTNSPSSSDKSRTSPWHTPVSLGGMSSSVARSSSSSTTATKPAIPVSPVVREDKNKDLSFQAALLGLGAFPATSMAAMSMPPTTYSMTSAVTAQQQSQLAAAVASNPYLAMTAGLPKNNNPGAGGYPSHMMDPATSAYYAALYSQSMYGVSPYGSAGMRFPGMQSAAPPPGPPPGAGGISGMDLLALHAMMSQGQNQAGSNPFAGYPAGLSGLLGYPPRGFPPPGGGGGRKDP
jgi:hypothetical protein